MGLETKAVSEVAPEYIHKRTVSYDSGARVKSLENVIYISLDTFKEKHKNKIETELSETNLVVN